MMLTLRWGAVLGAASLAACADSATGPAADETGQSDQAEIAFVSDRSAWPEIYVARADGSGVRRLAHGTAPAWSWDGRHLAFRRESNPYDRAGLYLIRSDGSGEAFLGVGTNPAWASDGTLAFSYGMNATGGNIAVIRPGAPGPRNLLPQGWALTEADQLCDDAWLAPFVDDPTWSADARQIAFTLGCPNEWSKLYVMDADGGNLQLVLDGAGRGTWSPDGSKLAVALDGITIIDMVSGVSETYHIAGIHVGWSLRVDWTPDGRQIAFSGLGSADRLRLFLLDLQNVTVRQLIPDTQPDYYSDVDVAWSRAPRSR